MTSPYTIAARRRFMEDPVNGGRKYANDTEYRRREGRLSALAKAFREHAEQAGSREVHCMFQKTHHAGRFLLCGKEHDLARSTVAALERRDVIRRVRHDRKGATYEVLGQ